MPFFHYIAVPKTAKEEENSPMIITDAIRNKFIDLIIESEGGYVNDPLDRGGATKFGITQKTLNSWTASKGAKAMKVRDLPLITARTIYRDWYFEPCSTPNLAVTLLIFDWGVNSGVATAIMGLQKIVGVKQDGIIGPRTNQAILEYAPREMLIPRIINRRHEFYAHLVGRDKTQAKFAVGWASRVTRLLTEVEKDRLFDVWINP